VVQWVSAPDGTRIAYESIGEGPALLLTNGLTTSTLFWKYLAPLWAERHRVITWDLPGHGRSQRPNTLACVEMEAQPAIMARILDAEGVARASHVGFSIGCQIVLEMARQEPARCQAVGLLLGTAGRVFDTLELPVGKLFPKLLLKMPPSAFVAWYALMARAAQFRHSGPVAKRLGLVGANAKDEDVQELAHHLLSLDAISLQRMGQSAARHSALDVLERLALPLLIVAGARDPFAPLHSVGRVLHAQNARSELLVLPNATHTALLDDWPLIGSAVERLLARVPSA
jgi:pimeloyl-ACP methyl ester carboxylesterase